MIDDDAAVPFDEKRYRARRFAKARAAANDGARVVDPEAPLASARHYLSECWEYDGLPTLKCHLGVLYGWRQGPWMPIEEAAIRADLYRWLEPAVRETSKGQVAFKPTAKHVGLILDALRAATHLPAETQAPAWLDFEPGRDLSPAELVVCENGLLDLRTSQLMKPSPAYWCHSSVAAPWLENSPPPEILLKLLGDIWPDDLESVETLQEIFGLLLVPVTKYQKIFLIVGPPRSGKGTIARVATALVGAVNVAAPTFASLGQPFGLAELVDKTVAIISDARLGGRADQSMIAERLLSISGEDTIQADRKYGTAWTGRLTCRLVIMSNELPRLNDPSGALPSRLLTLRLARSFLNREDHTLADRLIGELPSILAWAVEGWRRLEQRGHFVQPASAAEVADEIGELSSPVTAFLADECEIGAGLEAAAVVLYQGWRSWCDVHGRVRPGSSQSFGRDLRSAIPGLRVVQRRTDAGRERAYLGVAVR